MRTKTMFTARFVTWAAAICVFIALLLIVYSASLPGQQSRGDDQMSLDQPWYTCTIDLGGLPYEIRVNDCPIWKEKKGYSVKTEFPINKWIAGGKNYLSIKATPSSDHQPLGSVGIRVRAKGTDANNAQLVTNTKVAEALAIAARKESEGNNLNEITATVEFEANVPFPTSGWLRGPAISLSDEDRRTLEKLTKAFWDALSQKDIETVMRLLSIRIPEVAASQYQTGDEHRNDIRAEFEGVLNDPDLHVFEYYDDSLDIVTYAEGRLFTVVDQVSGKSPILFTDSEESMSIVVDLFFAKIANGEWAIVR